jgi:hypothetical protein
MIDTPKPREFSPGFRLSITDMLVLVAGSGGTIVASRYNGAVAVILAVVVWHFFLFCNVFRLSRPRELVWAKIFVGMTLCTIFTGRPAWPINIGASLAVAAFLIFLETRKPHYHGIAWSKLNPNLRAWWDAQG